MRDLGVTAREADPQGRTRVGDVGKDALGHLRSRSSGRQEHRRQEPARRRTHHRDVVGVHIDRIPPDLVGGKGDGVGFGDQVAVAKIKHGGILAGARPHDDARIAGREAGEKLFEQRQRQLAGGKQMWVRGHQTSDK